MEIFENLNLENLPNEIWTSISGYEGLYEISNMGRVKSCKKSFFGKLVNRMIELPEKIMKQTNTTDGYKQISLCFEGKRKTLGIHRLVFWSFNPLQEKFEGYQVDHADQIQTHNWLSNLQYIPERENSSKRSLQKYKSSKYTGVNFDKEKGKFASYIRINGKTKFLGRFELEKDASEAYLKAKAGS